MKIGIIDYEGGNLASVACAVDYLGFTPFITSEAKELLNCDRVIFPGVGAAGATMSALRKTKLIDTLKYEFEERRIPCLGICIGIQVLFEYSEEDEVETLGIFKGKVKRFSDEALKVPHIGWNQVHFVKNSLPILEGVQQDEYYYFVNSYYVDPDEDISLGTTQYGENYFTTFIQSRNWTASQFHLEKSGKAGLKLLNNFIKNPCL